MIKLINKAFTDTISNHSYFTGWEKKGGREFISDQDKVRRGIDCQLDKYWEKIGGALAVNLTCAHQLDVEFLGWSDEGFDSSFVRLAPLGKSDHWWKVGNDEEIETFKREFELLLTEVAVPWLESAKTVEGFLSLDVWTKGKIGLFPYQLQHLGKERFRSEFIKWIQTLPRQRADVFEWAARTGVIGKEISLQLIDASRQMTAVYESRVAEILERGVN